MNAKKFAALLWTEFATSKHFDDIQSGDPVTNPRQGEYEIKIQPFDGPVLTITVKEAPK